MKAMEIVLELLKAESMGVKVLLTEEGKARLDRLTEEETETTEKSA